MCQSDNWIGEIEDEFIDKKRVIHFRKEPPRKDI